MKNFITGLIGAVFMVLSSTSVGIEAGSWRLTVDQSVDEESAVSIMELEMLHDNDDDNNTVIVDALEDDLGYSICGWERAITTGSFAGTYQVGCDSLITNKLGDPNITIDITSDWRESIKNRRQIKAVLDNNFQTDWTTTDKVVPEDSFIVQYRFHTAQGLSRALPDVTSYSVTVPIDSIRTEAPGSWTVEYSARSNGNDTWVIAQTRTTNDVHWPDGDDIHSASGNYYLESGEDIRLWDGTNWGEPLTGTAETDAETDIQTNGEVVAKRLEFSFE